MFIVFDQLLCNLAHVRMYSSLFHATAKHEPNSYGQTVSPETPCFEK